MQTLRAIFGLLLLPICAVAAENGFESGTTDPVLDWRLRGPDGEVIREFVSTFQGTTETFEWRKDYVYLDGRLVYTSGNGSTREHGELYYVADHIGSTRLIVDGGGQVIASPNYLPFGLEYTVSDDGTPHRFTGHERDFAALDYMRARYYTPLTQRFYTPDPASDGWNRYAYTSNDPIGRSDPTGLAGLASYLPDTTEMACNYMGGKCNSGDFDYWGRVAIRATAALDILTNLGAAFIGMRSQEIQPVVESPLPSDALPNGKSLDGPPMMYPPNRGALPGTIDFNFELQPGMALDRRGSLKGFFASDHGARSNELAAPPTNAGGVKTLVVLKPFVVTRSIVAPAYGYKGLGVQYELNMSFEEAIAAGYLSAPAQQ